MISPTDPSPAFAPIRPKTADSERATHSQKEALYDVELMQRFKTGDDSAFVEIVTRYRERMFSVAFGILKNHADAEEIAQDTFVRAHRGLPFFRGDCSLATWLHRIALNLARNRYWYFFRRHRHASVSFDCAFSEANSSTLADLVATDTSGPEREVIAMEFSALIADCLERLGARPREILILRIYLDHSYGEIARELGISMGTVKSRIARARERLREIVVETCPEFGCDARHMALFDAIRPAGGVEAISA